MSGWQPIETAPKDGGIILSLWGRLPAFVAWAEPQSSVEVQYRGIWPFRRRVSSSRCEPASWRVVTYSPRHGRWLFAGNFASYSPTHWMPLPEPPEPGA